MLTHLLVKNLALIDRAEVEFGPGLNILTGETGAGKSILIDSVSCALGGKVSRTAIRQGADSAYVELMFSIESPRLRQALQTMDVDTEENTVIISRKITPQRTVSRINDMAVSAARLREITGLLIDIHGQHEHQSLLYRSRHLDILDRYGQARLRPRLEAVRESWNAWTESRRELEKYTGSEEERRRELDFLRFELREIGEAAIQDGEEERLEQAYRCAANGKKIAGHLQAASSYLEGDHVDEALAEVSEALSWDDHLEKLKDALYDIESMLEDVRRELQSTLEEQEIDEEGLQRMADRLDLIHSLEAKYGKTEADILEAAKEKTMRLAELEEFDQRREKALTRSRAAQEHLLACCADLTRERKAIAGELSDKISEKLSDLNFMDNRFSMEIRPAEQVSARGADEAEFMISANPGEPMRPLQEAASGGELSRIMLAVKSVLADTDEIPTLIFDEIDTGISGRTAQKVSEQLGHLAGGHQIICITHLPQIAAMADCHFGIKKQVEDGRTVTRLTRLAPPEMIDELARLLGGVEITEAVRDNAAEMKRLADRFKADEQRLGREGKGNK